MKKLTINQRAVFLLTFGLLNLLVAAFLLTNNQAVAQEETTAAPPPAFAIGSPLHPTFSLLDADGINVLQSNAPISTMQTCGTCHDTEFIAGHSVHADAGLSLVGQTEQPRAWQDSLGWYGGWNPITYTTAENMTAQAWVQTFGWRHVGGGPATEAGVEMNCFLCHMANPDNNARVTALETGQFSWASTATLNTTGIVEANGATWQYNPAAFDTDGQLLPEYVTVAEPRDANCGFCHGVVDGSNTQLPLTFNPFDETQWTTLTTGQVYSPERLSASGMNLADKNALSHSWDVHAERVVNCTDCHYSLNNPIFYVEPTASRPEHLEFDPRRMDFGDYLKRPLHQFANGGSHYVEAFPVFERAVRDCASCHNAETTHTWLEYPERHMQALACESCHIPELYAPALEYVDRTVLKADGTPQMGYRGTDMTVQPALLTGYQPVLLADAEGKLAPYNIISAWYWVYGDPAQPVTEDDLQAAWFEGAAYADAILATFDTDGDKLLSAVELVIDTEAKESLIAERLAALGLENPRIVGEAEPYAIHHNVTYGAWATQECSTCHSEDSRLTLPISLADRTPGGVQPTFISSDISGSIQAEDNGALRFKPSIDVAPNLYILGHDSVPWVDWAGVLIFLGVLLGVVVHGGLRYLALRRMPQPQEPELREVYMYSVYERQWHWLQSALIFGLIFTGLIIHKPDMFGMFSFRGVVFFHNGFALILVINAALAAFYHLVSGEIRQFLPKPQGFFGQMFAQVRYYAWGIFHGEPHPFEKTPDRKMNPIQQVTYFGLLNVLLPLQVITGVLMWGAQRFPDITAFFGGLPVLAPFHTLISWLLASFIVLHVYMTTTGHSPMANIRAMIFGWDEVETQPTHSPSAGD